MHRSASLLVLAVVLGVFAVSVTVTRASADPLKIAFVGDDTLRTLVDGDSAVPCGPAPFPAQCRYDEGSVDAVPNILGTSNTVYVFSSMGQTSGAGVWSVDTIVAVQVPRIDPGTDVVVIQAGAGDHAKLPDIPILAQRLITAVNQRAPKARVVVLGLRPSDPGTRESVDAWNSAFKAMSRVQFIDLSKAFPPADYLAFPDGVHPTKLSARQIAAMVTAAINGELPRSAPASAATRLPLLSLQSKHISALPPRATRMTIAVVGSSMDRNVVLDGSPVPCGLVMRAPPCKYEDQSPLSYPSFLAAIANARIVNLSVGGAQAADVRTFGTIPSLLDSQVPKIPPDANVVILDIGGNDTSINGMIEPILARVDKVTFAVRARAPKAIIIFLNLRDYATSISGRIDAWNAREARLAGKIGATVIDLRSRFPASDYADYPDGTHLSLFGALKVAQLIGRVLDGMRLPGPFSATSPK